MELISRSDIWSPRLTSGASSRAKTKGGSVEASDSLFLSVPNHIKVFEGLKYRIATKCTVDHRGNFIWLSLNVLTHVQLSFCVLTDLLLFAVLVLTSWDQMKQKGLMAILLSNLLHHLSRSTHHAYQLLFKRLVWDRGAEPKLFNTMSLLRELLTFSHKFHQKPDIPKKKKKSERSFVTAAMPAQQKAFQVNQKYHQAHHAQSIKRLQHGCGYNKKIYRNYFSLFNWPKIPFWWNKQEKFPLL